MKKSGVLSWLWRGSAGDKGKILAMTLVQILLGIFSVADAWLLRGIIDCAVDQDPVGFRRFCAGFIGLTLGMLALRAVYRHLTEDCKSSLENRFKGRLFQVLLNRDYAKITAVHSGEWMNRLTSDTQVVAEGLTTIVPEVTGMAVKLVGALAMLIYLIPMLSGLILLGGIALVVLTLAFRRQLKRLHKGIQERDGQLRSFLTERLSAMLVLRSFGQEQAAARQGEAHMQAHKAARMHRNSFSNLCNLGFGLAIQGAYVLGAVVCSYGILTGTMSYGTFTAVLQLITKVQAPFANLSGFLPKYYAAIASAERLMEAEDFPLDCPEGQWTVEKAWDFYQTAFAGIALEGAAFAYPGSQEPEVFRDMELQVRKGDYVAFTGHSGCGKSTVLKLLLALYPLKDGRVLLHTQAGEETLTARQRSLFAYVPQGNQLMHGTLRQVVSLSEQPDEKRLQQALETACAWEFVQGLEKGLDTLLSERGAGLSEGQLQRLAIARAVYSQRPILLLDEATSALDEATEAQVLKNLRAMTDKTVFIVTHRPAALEICNKEVHFG